MNVSFISTTTRTTTNQISTNTHKNTSEKKVSSLKKKIPLATKTPYLPPEMWDHIFEQVARGKDAKTLGKLSQVSKEFHSLMRNPKVRLANAHEKLKKLGFTTADEAITFAIGNKLSSINLEGILGINDTHIQQLIKGCPNLNHLSLDKTEVTDKSIIALSESSLPLTNLSLVNCRKLTDKSIIALSESSLPLVNLNLAFCDNLTDESIIAFEESSLSLSQLNLSACSKLTDDSILALAKSNLPLTKLDLSFSCRLTDKSIIALAESKLPLVNLNLVWCSNLTDKSIIALAESSLPLERLGLSCRKITTQSFLALNKFKPFLIVT